MWVAVNLTSIFISSFCRSPKMIPTLMRYFNVKHTSTLITVFKMSFLSKYHLHKVEDNIKCAGYFDIECDEVTDSSNHEQVIVCFWWVDDAFEPHEDFKGLCSVSDIAAELVFGVVNDAVIRMKLSMTMCRAQCYDGTANMKSCCYGQGN